MKPEKPIVFVVGASGFLGSLCAKYLRAHGYFVFGHKVDVTSRDELHRAFQNSKPDIVINFAGIRAPNIDWCEIHRQETIDVNVVGAANVMISALKIGAYPIHISSGCVYSGGIDTEFSEDDAPNFTGNLYSRMVGVTQEIFKEMPVLCARIRLPISYLPHPKNLLDKLISYGKVIPVPNSITYVEDLWPAIVHLFSDRPVGLLNMTNTGFITYDNVLEAYKKIINPEYKYEVLPCSDLSGLTAMKRSNCVLSTKKAESLFISMPPLTKDRLEDMMVRRRDEM
jgi:dTDP-4-dehydrorhamnose reductase